MRLVPRLVDSTMNLNSEMNVGLFLSLLTPRSFLMLILSVSSSPKLVVLLWVWVQLDESVKSRSTYVAARLVHRLFIVLAREPKRTRLIPTVLWTFDQAFYPCRIRTNHHCIALEQLSGRRPATSVHRYRFILPTWSNLTTLRGLVRSQSCLVRWNWTKKRECLTGTTVNKDCNYIDNCSSCFP